MTDPQPSCSENYQLQMRELLRNHERHFKQLGERSDHNNCSRCDIFVLQMDNFIKEVVSAKQKTIEELEKFIENWSMGKHDWQKENESLRAEVERLGNLVVMEGEPGQERTWKDEALSLITMTEEQQAQLSRLKEILKGKDEIFKWLMGEVSDFPIKQPGDGHYYWRKELRARLQALSKTWEEGEK